jgi:molybdate transport system substrate-binding protein
VLSPTSDQGFREVKLQLLSAGAAKSVVEALAPVFRDETGVEIDATFGAVGAIKDKLDGGASCDVIVLSAKLIDELADANRVLVETIAALGAVCTGVAVRDGDAPPRIDDEASLRAAFASAGAIYFPDPERATAGIHFMSVIRKLGIDRVVAARLRPFPNGATAMRALADEGRQGDVGCTQMTEIRYTAGVTAVGPLPRGFDLSTVYSAAVVQATEEPDLARLFIALLTGPRSAALRIAGGFDV